MLVEVTCIHFTAKFRLFTYFQERCRKSSDSKANSVRSVSRLRFHNHLEIQVQVYFENFYNFRVFHVSKSGVRKQISVIKLMAKCDLGECARSP